MSTRNRLLPLFLLLPILPTQAVFSQDEPRENRGGKMPVQEVDLNGDGRVTREEWSRAFDRYDANQDGVLTTAEIRAGARAVANPYAERFESLDRDRDGYVSRTEWPLEAASFNRVDRDDDDRLSRSELMTPNRDLTADERFRVLDTNRDGLLSPSELQSGGESRTLDRDRNGSVSRGEYRDQAAAIEDTWRTRSTPRTQSRFRFLDRNSDNRVSRLEWTGARADFNRLDRNRDGVLSPNEWPER
jgi:Ca2+-binding EF-hand superfamily protein